LRRVYFGCESGAHFLKGRATKLSTQVDQANREIHLLTTEARLVDIKYDADTVLYNHDRKFRVDASRHGD